MSIDLIALSQYLQTIRGLEVFSECLLKEYNLLLQVGVEVEFYLPAADLVNLAATTSLIFKQEKGTDQYEFELPPTTEILKLIADVSALYQLLHKKTEGKIIFAAKPYPQSYGNSLHFHLNLIDVDTHKNLFADISILENAARGLCTYMQETFLVFAPTEEDYLRFTKGFLAPTHICFGGNNRTTAVRIPDSNPKRLEHRLASPLIDLYLGIFVLQKSLYLSLQNSYSVNIYPKIYGNAFDEQYNLSKLPQTRKEALVCFNPRFFSLPKVYI